MQLYLSQDCCIKTWQVVTVEFSHLNDKRAIRRDALITDVRGEQLQVKVDDSTLGRVAVVGYLELHCKIRPTVTTCSCLLC